MSPLFCCPKLATCEHLPDPTFFSAPPPGFSWAGAAPQAFLRPALYIPKRPAITARRAKNSSTLHDRPPEGSNPPILSAKLRFQAGYRATESDRTEAPKSGVPEAYTQIRTPQPGFQHGIIIFLNYLSMRVLGRVSAMSGYRGGSQGRNPRRRSRTRPLPGSGLRQAPIDSN